MASQLFINQRSSAKTDPIRNFRFLVKFTPYIGGGGGPSFDTSIGFTAVSGLAVSTEAIPYREGGYQSTPHYIPGQQTFSPVTFQRGVTIGSRQHWDWFLKLFDPGYSTSGSAEVQTGDFRCEVDISVLAHPASPRKEYESLDDYREINNVSNLVVQRFKLLNAWPANLAYSDLQAGDNGVLVESMTVVHEGLVNEWSKKPEGVL